MSSGLQQRWCEDDGGAAVTPASGRPNLFLVGAPKCGTTALTRYLEAHPEIAGADRKDLHHFGSDLDFRGREPLSEADYLAHFGDGGRWTMDSGVWMLRSERAAEEIHAFAPEARIICMVRQPVDMMHALFTQLRINGLGEEDLPDLQAALAAEEDRARGDRIPDACGLRQALQYREAVQFSAQIGRYLERFGQEQVRVVLQDEFAADTASTYRELLGWLGIDPDFQPDFRRVNTHKEVRSEGVRAAVGHTPQWVKALLPGTARQWLRGTLRKANARHAERPPLDPTLRATLTEELRPEIHRLEALLGRDLSHWLS
jgi:hypothetical protein